MPSAVSSYYVKNRSYATVNLELAYDAATDSIKAYANGVEKSFGDKFPIGTILPYIGSLNAIPAKWHLCDGTAGTPNLTGRFLQGWGSDDFYWRNPGEYVQEGLPNIWGALNDASADTVSYAFTITYGILNGGYVYSVASEGGFSGGPRGEKSKFSYIDFNANRCSWLYGNSVTVQPRSYVVYYIMKVQA